VRCQPPHPPAHFQPPHPSFLPRLSRRPPPPLPPPLPTVRPFFLPQGTLAHSPAVPPAPSPVLPPSRFQLFQPSPTIRLPRPSPRPRSISNSEPSHPTRHAFRFIHSPSGRSLNPTFLPANPPASRIPPAPGPVSPARSQSKLPPFPPNGFRPLLRGSPSRGLPPPIPGPGSRRKWRAAALGQEPGPGPGTGTGPRTRAAGAPNRPHRRWLRRTAPRPCPRKSPAQVGHGTRTTSPVLRAAGASPPKFLRASGAVRVVEWLRKTHVQAGGRAGIREARPGNPGGLLPRRASARFGGSRA
jgi:hypothetical protein